MLKTKQSVMEELVQDTQKNIAHFFENFDLEAAGKLVDHICASSATLFLTGVGKSGIIAKKIAMTMSSSGTKALYLSPLGALHGDVGIVSKGDIVLFFSKSGETDELLHLCPAIRNKGASLVAIVSNKESRLVKACDFHIVLPVGRELCPFDMVPTTSTLMQHIFGDFVAIALMRAKSFTRDDFAQNHPAGRLGKRMTFTVKDLMVQGDALPIVSSQDILITVLPEFSSKKCGCLLITDSERRLLGIFTDGDLRRSLQKHGAMVLHKTMGELMIQAPLSIDVEQLAYDAMKCMEQDPLMPVTVLPVIDQEKRVVGIIRMHDIVQSGI